MEDVRSVGAASSVKRSVRLALLAKSAIRCATVPKARRTATKPQAVVAVATAKTASAEQLVKKLVRPAVSARTAPRHADAPMEWLLVAKTEDA